MRAIVLAAALNFSLPWSLPARDAFVFLSGGGTEMDNNYSQYLQARAMVKFFEDSYPRDSVWIFFGAGNVEGAKPVFSDVYREVKRDDILIDTWLPGTLPRNRPATREEFLPALKTEILPTVANGGTLYLFVGDHGTRPRRRNSESQIVFWGMHHDDLSDNGWSERDNETLGVSELQHALTGGIGKGRVVFCMTQCFAGGFHYMAVPHEMTPEASWFTRVPSWAKAKTPATAPLRAAGYTATDEFSPAAGCDPSPDPDEWAGYERYLPESLLGLNLFTLEHSGSALPSFGEAHIPASLADQTIDKPRSTSEQYLERWAELIETRLMRESDLTPAVKKAVADYNLAINGHLPKLADAAFSERAATFQKFTEKLAGQNDSSLLLSGTRVELEDAASQQPMSMDDMPATPRTGRGGRRGTRRLWERTLRPAWKSAVESHENSVVPTGATDFETFLLDQEDKGTDYFFGTGDDLRDDVFWQAGYGNPQTLNKDRAEAIALWGQERRDKILAWGKGSTNDTVHNAAERLEQYVSTNTPSSTAMDAEEKAAVKEAAAQRALFYRRVLAAWQFLIEVNDHTALARVRELTALERTALPAPK